MQIQLKFPLFVHIICGAHLCDTVSYICCAQTTIEQLQLKRKITLITLWGLFFWKNKKKQIYLIYTEDITLSKKRVHQDDDEEDEEVVLEEEGEEDDDEVPEAVSFSSGREAALQQMKTALQQIGQNKQKLKDKRRQIDEQFKIQKVRNKTHLCLFNLQKFLKKRKFNWL